MPWCSENEQLKTLMGEWPFSQMTKLGNLRYDCFFSPTEIGPASEPMLTQAITLFGEVSNQAVSTLHQVVEFHIHCRFGGM